MTTGLVETHGAVIRKLHDEARELAGRAIDKAAEAGRLLREVKEQLPHGSFGSWVQSNCGFSQRTAQRYMDLYRNPDRLRAPTAEALVDKCDTVSLLEWIEPSVMDWTTITLPNGTRIDVTPSSKHPGFLHVSVMEPTGDGGADVVETKRPVRPDFVFYVVNHELDDTWMLGTRESVPCPNGFDRPIWAAVSQGVA